MRFRDLRLRFDELVKLVDLILNFVELKMDELNQFRHSGSLEKRLTLMLCVIVDPAAISATYFSRRETPGRLTSSETISPLAVTVVFGAVGKVTELPESAD